MRSISLLRILLLMSGHQPRPQQPNSSCRTGRCSVKASLLTREAFRGRSHREIRPGITGACLTPNTTLPREDATADSGPAAGCSGHGREAFKGAHREDCHPAAVGDKRVSGEDREQELLRLLERGYAIIEKDGRAVKSVQAIEPGTETGADEGGKLRPACQERDT